MEILITTINLIYYVVLILIFARFILSWVNFGPYELRAWVFRLTEPILAPVRRFLPPTAGVDFSPMIVLLGISLLRRLLIQIVI
jgi:YggT family protein